MFFLESRIRRGIFGPKCDENWEWRSLLNKELHSFYRSPNIVKVIKSRRLRWAHQVARMEECWSAIKTLTGNKSLGRTRGRWEDNTRIDLKEI